MFKNIDAAMKGNVENSYSYAEYSRELYQLEIDKHFIYANNYYEIEIENKNGTNIFEKQGVRIDKAVNVNTGVKLSDDFKKIIFQKDAGITPGRKFSFGNNTWLTMNVSALYTNSVSCIVRRCNNLLRYKYGEEFESEPCILEYNSTGNQLENRQEIILPNKTIKIYLQDNIITNKISINQRFIFGSQVFKVVSFEDYNRLNTFDKEIGLRTIFLELDAKGANDDFINDIAEGGLTIENLLTIETSADEVIVPVNEQRVDTILQVNPELFIIREGQHVGYEFSIDNENITDKITWVVKSKLPQNSFKIIRQEGKINIYCIHKNYDIPLKVEFQYLEYKKEVSFKLRGMF